MLSNRTPPARICSDYLKDDWQLPSKENAHDLVRLGKYEWRLLSRMDSKWRKIVLKCTTCRRKEYLQLWPVNWTTLAGHYRSVHKMTLDEIRSGESESRAREIELKNRLRSGRFTTNYSVLDDPRIWPPKASPRVGQGICIEAENDSRDDSRDDSAEDSESEHRLKKDAEEQAIKKGAKEIESRIANVSREKVDRKIEKKQDIHGNRNREVNRDRSHDGDHERVYEKSQGRNNERNHEGIRGRFHHSTPNKAQDRAQDRIQDKTHNTKNKKELVGLPSGKFNTDKYSSLLTRMIVSNNLSFSLVESSSFKDVLSFLNKDAPHVDTQTLKKSLGQVYETEAKKLHTKLAENTGRFALTAEVCQTPQNIDFLGVTVHFYNNDFKLEKYTLGYEELGKHFTYTGERMCECMMSVLRRFGIEQRVVSITRLPGLRQDLMIENVRKSMANATDKTVKFDGDIQCVSSIMGLCAEIVLNYTLFNTTATRDFFEKIEDTKYVDGTEVLPDTVRSLIRHILSSKVEMEKFKKQVSDADKTNSPQNICEKLVLDRPGCWRSTYQMIDHFVGFRKVISEMCSSKCADSGTNKPSLNDFSFSEGEWSYLEKVRDALTAFDKFATKIEKKSFPTIPNTILPVSRLSKGLDEFLTPEYAAQNPLISSGAREAKGKLMEFYSLEEDTIEGSEPLYLSMVLDPRLKLAVFDQAKFSAKKKDLIKGYFHKIYAQYRSQYGLEEEKGSSCERRDSIDILDFYDSSDTSTAPTAEEETSEYLFGRREKRNSDPIAYYEARQDMFPIIARMARDYLAVPSTCASTNALSTQMETVASNQAGKFSPTEMRISAVLQSLKTNSSGELQKSCLRVAEAPSSPKKRNKELNRSPVKRSKNYPSPDPSDLLVLDTVEEDESALDGRLADFLSQF